MKIRDWCLSTLHVFSVTCTILGVGCGGGTTGTSSTTELRLLGRVITDLGAPVALVPMRVVSISSNRTLVESRTGSLGDFFMETRRPDSGVQVVIGGATSAAIDSSLTGDVSTSLVITQSASGGLRVHDVISSSLRSSSECQDIEVTGSTVIVRAPASDERCRVIMAYESVTDVPVLISVIGVCSNSERVLQQVETTPGSGEIKMDLSSLARFSCEKGRILVQTLGSGPLPIVYGVERAFE